MRRDYLDGSKQHLMLIDAASQQVSNARGNLDAAYLAAAGEEPPNASALWKVHADAVIKHKDAVDSYASYLRSIGVNI